MAERRMFAKTIIDSDSFLDMPLSTQALYFHLSMRGDDDGFVNSPKKIAKMIGSSDDEIKLLIAKKFIIGFESGIVVIKHWKIHNYIQKDRYKATVYDEEMAQLGTSSNNGYTLDTQCIQVGDTGKDRIGKSKDSIGKSKDTKIYLPAWLDMKAWGEWVAFRKEIKKTLTKSMIEKQIEFLGRYEHTHIEIINQSIQNGWTGLFELKRQAKQQQVYAPVDGMRANDMIDAMIEKENQDGYQNSIS